MIKLPIILGHQCAMNTKIRQTNIFTWMSQNSQTSIMYSKSRHKWIQGPTIPSGIKFVSACGLSLNRNMIMFVGVSRLPFETTINNITIMYDFKSRKWEFQDDLPNLMNEHYTFYYTSCAIDFGKDVENGR